MVSQEILRLIHLQAECRTRHRLEQAMEWPVPTRHPGRLDPHAVRPLVFPDLPKIWASHLKENNVGHGMFLYRVVLRKDRRKKYHFIMDYHRDLYPPDHWQKQSNGQWILANIGKITHLLIESVHCCDEMPSVRFRSGYYYYSGPLDPEGHLREKQLRPQDPHTNLWYKTTIHPEGWQTMRTHKYWIMARKN